MTIKQAQHELSRPLVFGDALQIKALELLDDRPKDSVLERAKDSLSDFVYDHKDTECSITLEQTAEILDELKYILGNHLTQ